MNTKFVYQTFNIGEFDAALKLHQAHLSIARSLQDRAGMGRAYGNIGNAYSAAGFYDSAIKYHKQELTISKVSLSFIAVSCWLVIGIYILGGAW